MSTVLAPPAASPSGVSPAPANTPAVPASPADGSVTPSPGVSPQQDGNIRQLREQYEATKAERDKWSGLGKFDEVSTHVNSWRGLHKEATELGETLGFDPAEIQAAWSKDPVQLMAFLRQQQRSTANQPQDQPQDISKLVDRELKKHLKPFQEREEQRLNAEAESRFDGAFDRAFKTQFPNGLPDSNREAIQGLAWSILKENGEGYKALREKGLTVAADAAIKEGTETFLRIVNDYLGHERKRTGGKLPDDPGTTKKVTLDDIINDPGKIHPKYAKK